MDKVTQGRWNYGEATNGLACEISTMRILRQFTRNKSALVVKDVVCERVIETDANLICTAVNACKEINPDNPQAAAEAIPDMLAALKELKHWIYSHTGKDQAIKTMINAIAKATGEK